MNTDSLPGPGDVFINPDVPGSSMLIMQREGYLATVALFIPGDGIMSGEMELPLPEGMVAA